MRMKSRNRGCEMQEIPETAGRCSRNVCEIPLQAEQNRHHLNGTGMQQEQWRREQRTQRNEQNRKSRTTVGRRDSRTPGNERK
jgi:hypothetical protein